MREKQPRREIVNRPTRDLKETEYGRWQDAELPDDRVWSGGSRDFDERSGTYRPGHRDDDYKFTQTDKGRNRERRRPEQKRDWWQEPRRDYRPEKTSKERRMELLTGGTGTGGSSYSDRQSLLTGRGLSSNEDSNLNMVEEENMIHKIENLIDNLIQNLLLTEMFSHNSVLRVLQEDIQYLLSRIE